MNKKTVFWVKFFNLPCKVIADGAWLKYFRKYYQNSGTKVVGTPGRGKFATLILKSKTGHNCSDVYFDAIYKDLTCTVYSKLSDHSVYPMISNTLQRLFTRLIYFYGGLVIHSSTVMKQGKAYIFVGHSGAGKTTAARLSLEGGCEILSDNFTFILSTPKGYVVYPFPFDPFHNHRIKNPVPIAGIYFLKKSKTHKVTPVALPARLKTLIGNCQIQAPEGMKAGVEKPLFKLIHSVSMYTLYFAKNAGFVKLVVK